MLGLMHMLKHAGFGCISLTGAAIMPMKALLPEPRCHFARLVTNDMHQAVGCCLQ